MSVSMLTTTDNPFDPFTQFDEWNAYDQAMGYNTAAYLARVITTSDDLSDADQSAAIEDAINDILNENVLGIYKRVTLESSNPGS